MELPVSCGLHSGGAWASTNYACEISSAREGVKGEGVKGEGVKGGGSEGRENRRK